MWNKIKYIKLWPINDRYFHKCYPTLYFKLFYSLNSANNKSIKLKWKNNNFTKLKHVKQQFGTVKMYYIPFLFNVYVFIIIIMLFA